MSSDTSPRDASVAAPPAPDHSGVTSEESASQATAQTGGTVSGRSASLWSDAWRELRHNPIFVLSALAILVFAVMAAWPSLFTNVDPRECSLANSSNSPTSPNGGRPSADNWFGYDVQGCDYYSRVIYGAKVSLLVGTLTVAGAVLVAVVLGCIAGYYGGILDSIIARLTDIWFAIPLTLGAIVFLNTIRSGLEGREGWFGAVLAGLQAGLDWFDGAFGQPGFAGVILVLLVFGWPTMMRLTRSAVLSTKEEDYVRAAKALGARDFRILTRHILPNAIAPVIVYATISVGVVIAAEATLSFLGVGLQLPAISWGLMISVAETQIRNAPHLLLFPGVLLSIMVLSFIMMGDALRDALDPKLR